jgi:hypothetical protein
MNGSGGRTGILTDRPGPANARSGQMNTSEKAREPTPAA